jgi:UDP-glucose 4-epimerase
MAIYSITGGCGFIGSHLADHLVAVGHRVRVLDDLSTGRVQNLPQRADLIHADVADPAPVARAMKGVDGCFHLAAVASVQRSNEAWLETHRINAGGTICVLEAARAEQVPVVFASSAAAYGCQKAPLVKESSPAAPLTAYGADKLASELHARVASLVHAVPTLGLRFFNVYGPRQSCHSPYSGVISVFVHRVLARKPLNIHGDGQQVRDFIYVEDAVRFLVAGMEAASPDPAVFNVCTGVPTAVGALAMTIQDLCSPRVPLVFHPARAGDIRWSLGSPELAAAHLGLRAQVKLMDGLRATIESLTAPEAKIDLQTDLIDHAALNLVAGGLVPR